MRSRLRKIVPMNTPDEALSTRRLGTTDLEITTLGFGAWAVGGGGWVYGLGSQDDASSIAAIHRAVDSGVNWIDTAAIYGFGHSEGGGRSRSARDPGLPEAVRVHQGRPDPEPRPAL